MTTIDQRTPAPTEESEPAASKWVARLGGGWIFLALLGMIATFTLLRPGQFATPFNLTTLVTNAAVLLVLSIGQTCVIITAGIDLSVGSVLVFSSVVSAKFMLALSGAPSATYGTTQAGWGIIALGLLAGLAAGLLWGAFNGFLIAIARVPPLIGTLGTFGMALGFAQIITGGQDVRAVPFLLVDWVGQGTIAGIPILIVIAAITAVVAAFVLHLTRFGERTYAIGSSKEAARRAGIRVRSHLFKVYCYAGVLAGLAGFMSIARFATTTIDGHTTDNLATISAAVLGGASLFGGLGSIPGTVIGVFIPIVLLNGFVILGIPPFWQTVAMGAVLIIAVYIDQIKRRARERP